MFLGFGIPRQVKEFKEQRQIVGRQIQNEKPMKTFTLQSP